MQFSKSILFAAVALVAPFAVNADSIVTGTIAAPVTANGLTFTNIGCSISSNGGAASTPGNCAGIGASNITVPGNGIQFSSDISATAGAFEDVTLNYTVSSTAGIKDVGLYFNGQIDGLGITSVTESIFNGGSLVGYLQVSCQTNGCSPYTNELENIVLNGSYTQLSVQKDIKVNSNSVVSGNNASVSIIDQTFTTDAPEPASLALCGAGMLLAGAIRRKMVKA